MIEVLPDSYRVNDVRYDRITAILKYLPDPGLQEWREQVGKARANRSAKHAATIGKQADKWITTFLMTQQQPIPPSIEVRQACKGFREWHRLNPITPLATQFFLVDEVRQVAGTADCLTATEGVDWKTSSQFHLSQLLQINEYWRMATLHGLALKQFRLVRCDKILATWEELILRSDGIDWHGQLISRDQLSSLFDHLLATVRGWRALAQPEEV